MSSLSFISLIVLLTADTLLWKDNLVCTPCAAADNEVVVLVP